MIVILFAGLALLVSPVGTLADRTPNHDSCDATFPMPIPGEEYCCGEGSILWVTMSGLSDDHGITNTTFDITQVTDGVTPPSDTQLHGTAMVDGDLAEFIITGGDLGSGSGPGTFTGTYHSDPSTGWPTRVLSSRRIRSSACK